MKGLCAGIVLCVGLGFAGSASASLVTYDVDMNFDPDHIDGGPGVGTITGMFTLDTSGPVPVFTNFDLTEATNNGDTFGGADGSATYTSLAFTNTNSLASASPTGSSTLPYLFRIGYLDFIDGTIPVGPTFQFDFPYPQGGAVQPGNFDSITQGSNYLYGTVTPAATGPAPVPEPSSLAVFVTALFGVSGIAFMRRNNRQS